jgi:hypothetical protein
MWMSAGTAVAARLVFECVATAHAHAGAVEQAALGSAANESAELAASEQSDCDVRRKFGACFLIEKEQNKQHGSFCWAEPVSDAQDAAVTSERILAQVAAGNG